jgi:hypothetical protein
MSFAADSNATAGAGNPSGEDLGDIEGFRIISLSASEYLGMFSSHTLKASVMNRKCNYDACMCIAFYRFTSQYIYNMQILEGAL